MDVVGNFICEPCVKKAEALIEAGRRAQAVRLAWTKSLRRAMPFSFISTAIILAHLARRASDLDLDGDM
jgi:hypothetical protein